MVLAVVLELRVLVPAVLELRVAVPEPVLRVAVLEPVLRVLELLLVTVDLEPLGETVLILVLLDPVFATRLRVVVEAALRAVEVAALRVAVPVVAALRTVPVLVLRFAEVSVPVLRLVVVPVAVVAAVRVVVPEAVVLRVALPDAVVALRSVVPVFVLRLTPVEALLVELAEAALRVLVVVVRTFVSLSSRTTLAFITLVEGEDMEVFTTRCARSALRTVNERSG